MSAAPRSTRRRKSNSSSNTVRKLPLKSKSYGSARVCITNWAGDAMLAVMSGPLCMRIRLENADLPTIRDALPVVLAQLFHPGQEPRVDALLGRDATAPAAPEIEEFEGVRRQGNGVLNFTLMGEGVRLDLHYYADSTFVFMTPLELLQLYEELGIVLNQAQKWPSEYQKHHLDSSGKQSAA